MKNNIHKNSMMDLMFESGKTKPRRRPTMIHEFGNMADLLFEKKYTYEPGMSREDFEAKNSLPDGLEGDALKKAKKNRYEAWRVKNKKHEKSSEEKPAAEKEESETSAEEAPGDADASSADTASEDAPTGADDQSGEAEQNKEEQGPADAGGSWESKVSLEDFTTAVIENPYIEKNWINNRIKQLREHPLSVIWKQLYDAEQLKLKDLFPWLEKLPPADVSAEDFAPKLYDAAKTNRHITTKDEYQDPKVAAKFMIQTLDARLASAKVIMQRMQTSNEEAKKKAEAGDGPAPPLGDSLSSLSPQDLDPAVQDILTRSDPPSNDEIESLDSPEEAEAQASEDITSDEVNQAIEENPPEDTPASNQENAPAQDELTQKYKGLSDLKAFTDNPSKEFVAAVFGLEELSDEQLKGLQEGAKNTSIGLDRWLIMAGVK